MKYRVQKSTSALLNLNYFLLNLIIPFETSSFMLFAMLCIFFQKKKIYNRDILEIAKP